jgi:alkylation response protein AidB-like acyl-CoA dehydrogenase
VAKQDHDTAEVSQLRESVRAWITENWDPDLRTRDWMDRVVGSGWACPSWPPEWFGKGMTTAQARVVVDEFARARVPGAGHDIANLSANVLLAHGSDDVKRQYLRPALTGEASFCLLYSEPGAGSDLASVQTGAVRDGDEWVVNGQKVWTSGGHTAHHGLLLARTDWDVPKHRGLTYFLFPMHQDGVEVRPIKMITGASHFNEVFLTDARVPDGNILGELNGGWRVMQTALAYERVIMGGGAPLMFPKRRSDTYPEGGKPSSDALAVPEVDLVALAKANGSASDPVIRQALVQLHILKTVNRWNALRARAEMKRGYSSPAASIGKLAMSNVLHSGGRVHASVLGAEAMLAAPSSDRAGICTIAILNAYVTSIGGGTDQIQRNILGERVLGLPKEPETDKDIPFRDVLKSPGTTR